MNILTRIAAAVILITSVPAAIASQDRILPWSEARIVSPGQADTGPIVVTAKADGNNWQRCDVEAFGRKFQLDEKQLAILKGFPLNSLQIDYGSYGMGGAENAVYVEFSTSESNGKQTTTTTVTIVVTKDRAVEVRPPEKIVSIPNP